MMLSGRARPTPRQTALAGAALIALSIGLLLAQRGSAGFAPLRGLATGVFAPILAGGRTIREGTQNAWASLFSAEDLQAENDALREELALLRTRTAAASDQVTELRQSAALAKALPDFSPDARTARIIGPVPDGAHRRLWIDLGSDDGIQAGQAAIGAEGVLGRVLETGRHHSIVQLLTDGGSRWGGVIAQRSDSGVLEGTGDPEQMVFRFETTAAEVAP